MKTFKLTLFFLAICSFSFAQDSISVEKSYKYEIGLNVTSFASQFLNFSGNQFNSGPYLFTFKNAIGESQYFRAGLGLDYRSFLEEDDLPNSPQFNNNSYSIRVRLGVEKQIPIGKRWLFAYGIDLPITYLNSSSNSFSQFEDVVLTNISISGGFGPVLGIHFNINNRVRIGSEATLYLNYARTTQKTKIDGSEADSSSIANINAFLTSPTVLYLGITL